MSNEIRVRVVRRKGRKYYQLEWQDPITGKTHSQTTRTTNKRDARRKATDLEDQLRDGTHGMGQTNWVDFREAYLEDGLFGRADGTYRNAVATLNLVEKHIKPRAPHVINEHIVSQFKNRLRKDTIDHRLPDGTKETRPLSVATVNRHLRTLKAILRWAKDNGHIRKVPTIKPLPNAPTAKARPITPDEFERMLAAVPKVVDGDADQRKWKLLLRGLWLSGFRLGEALALRWHEGPIHVDIRAEPPVVHFSRDSQKNKKDQKVPCVPEFTKFLHGLTDQEGQEGYVFDIASQRVHVGGKSTAITARRVDTVGKVITEIGHKANVKTNAKGKAASAHDLRRSFGAQWSAKVAPIVLMQLMRHASVETTVKYYATSDAIDVVAAAVWGAGASQLDTTADTCPDGDHDNPDKTATNT